MSFVNMIFNIGMIKSIVWKHHLLLIYSFTKTEFLQHTWDLYRGWGHTGNQAHPSLMVPAMWWRWLQTKSCAYEGCYFGWGDLGRRLWGGLAQRLEWTVGMSRVGILGTSVQGRGTGKSKGPEMGLKTPEDWGQYQGWGQALALTGDLGQVLSHGYPTAHQQSTILKDHEPPIHWAGQVGESR